MINIKSISFSILLLMVIFFINTSTTFAHSGRTDASGCHTKRSTGEYHCHNGSSSNSYSSNSSSTYDAYQYKDNDNNGINDYEQNQNDLYKNLQSMGDEDGYQDAVIDSYNPDTVISNLSNVEYSWFKQGYDEGYNRRQLEILKNEAQVEGYDLGLSTDEKVTPAKFTISKEVQALFDPAFLKGQKERWVKIAEEAATSFSSFSIPEHLPQEVKESAQKSFAQQNEIEKKTAYEEGYASAFSNEQLILPYKYEQAPLMKEQYEKGFHENSEISTYHEEAYKGGKQGKMLDIPYEVSINGGEELYRKHFEKGKKERNLKLGIIWVAIFTFSIPIIYIIRKRNKVLDL
jgi:hypothetical protein